MQCSACGLTFSQLRLIKVNRAVCIQQHYILLFRMKLKTNTSNTVRRTIVLMTASMLLLTSFVLYWLLSQYNVQQQVLRKELLTDITALQHKIADSIILEKYLGPTLKHNKDPLFTINPLKKKNGDTFASLTRNTITFHSSSNDPKVLDSIKKAMVVKMDTGRMFFATVTMTNEDSTIPEHKIIAPAPPKKLLENINLNTTIKLNQPGSSDTPIINTLYTVLRTVVKEAMKDSINKLSVVLEPQDFELVYKEFAKGLSLRNNAMKATWHNDTSAIRPDSTKTMLVHYSIYNNKGSVAITGYRAYLLQKLIPQFLFVLLLLAVVSFAFMVTYRAMQRQIKLSEMKDGLISNMSHELKTPVATVKVALEAMDDYDIINNPQQAREYIHMARLETQRLEMLITKALNTSLMEQGKINLQKNNTDIALLTEEIIQSLKLRALQNNTHITLRTKGTNFTMNIDKLHVQGAILNIIDNSIKYGTPPVNINIDIIAQDVTVTVHITDNGPGIPENYIAQVFDKFFRVPTGDMHNVQGYGLGLSYVKQVMQLHNGVAQVNNIPGDGCRFTLQFFMGR